MAGRDHGPGVYETALSLGIPVSISIWFALRGRCDRRALFNRGSAGSALIRILDKAYKEKKPRDALVCDAVPKLDSVAVPRDDDTELEHPAEPFGKGPHEPRVIYTLREGEGVRRRGANASA